MWAYFSTIGYTNMDICPITPGPIRPSPFYGLKIAARLYTINVHNFVYLLELMCPIWTQRLAGKDFSSPLVVIFSSHLTYPEIIHKNIMYLDIWTVEPSANVTVHLARVYMSQLWTRCVIPRGWVKLLYIHSTFVV